MSTDTALENRMTAGPLAGRTALVTGASSGIGAALARRLAGDGAAVAGIARRADRLAALGPGVTAIAADVTDRAALAAAVERTVAEVGAPDLVVANAGVMLPSPAAEAHLDEWRRMIDLNLAAVAGLVAATVAHLQAAAAAGRAADLVVTSSIADTQVFPGYAAYTATKAGVTAFTRALRLELAPLGVRTTVVRPGLTTTELADRVEHDGARAELDLYRSAVPSIGADDVAGIVASVLALPRHVNVTELPILPTAQAVAV